MLSHGGKRKGAGRKPADGARKLKPRLVSLDEATVKKARKVGEGELSLGLRRCVEAYNASLSRTEPAPAGEGSAPSDS